ncbi:MAG: hypothetical protein ABEN55_20880 [Bradymonadaceae bacterium]
MIDIRKVNERQFEVTVDGTTTTEHTVTVEPKYYRRLTGENVSREELVERSFEFLLDREPNTAILSEFELPDINDYFPAYENIMRQELTKG